MLDKNPATRFTSGLLGVTIVISAGKTNRPDPWTSDTGWGIREILFCAAATDIMKMATEASRLRFIRQTLVEVNGLYKYEWVEYLLFAPRDSLIGVYARFCAGAFLPQRSQRMFCVLCGVFFVHSAVNLRSQRSTRVE